MENTKNEEYKTNTDVAKTIDSNYDSNNKWMFDMLDNIKNGSED